MKLVKIFVVSFFDKPEDNDETIPVCKSTINFIKLSEAEAFVAQLNANASALIEEQSIIAYESVADYYNDLRKHALKKIKTVLTAEEHKALLDYSVE